MDQPASELIELLDKSIANTRDLHVLNNLLDMKLISAASNYNKTSIHFDPGFLLEKDIADFDFVFNILDKAFKVCDNPHSFLREIELGRDLVVSINNYLFELSEAYPIIRLYWIKTIRKQGIFLEAVLQIYLQGALITKDERTEFNVCQEFLDNTELLQQSYELEELSNPNLLNAASRLLALKTIISIGHQDVELVLESLKEKYMQHFKKRYFPDSKVHYEKLRILQALLLLVAEVELSEEKKNKIASFVFNCFKEETNQNCVKQLLNWILILVLKNVNSVLEFIDSKPNSLSPSIIISVMPTLYHLTLNGDEATLEKTIKIALPWTMGAQFRLRVYAQDLIKRLLEEAKLRKLISFLKKYEHLEHCILSCIKATGDIFVTTMKSDLVFLNNCNPIEDKSWYTILYDVPRLNKVYQTEWQNIGVSISNPALLNEQENAKLLPANSRFSDSINIFLTKEDKNTQEIVHEENQLLHIQKKITPWKSALENVETQVKTDFILVASLIDKYQNLGGLSRTCEVFGIRNIVLNDAKVTNEKEFKSLSMSSETWINAIEVKVKDLKEYLLRLQSEGYCVIGAEQTAGSKKLNEFQFPAKMALVLGNEKTGVPPDIIPLLNICLEIPQFGQTRSLNVHVAGATFIWEYAKQHLV